MRNLIPVLIGVTGLMATGFCYAIYRKDKEIEKLCNCNKSPEVAGANGGRSAMVLVNTGAVVGSTGGGRSAGEMSVVRPGGVAVATMQGANSNASYAKNSYQGDNRHAEFYENVFQRNNLISDPLVTAQNGSHAIANGQEQIFNR